MRLQPFLRSSADNFDWAGRPHIQTFTVTGPFNADGHRRHAKPSRDLHAVVRRARDASATARRRSSAGSLAAPTGNRSRRRSSSRSSASTTRPARTARSRAASSAASSASSRARASPSASSTILIQSRRARRTASRTSSSPRGCPSSCGAAFRTTRCSMSRAVGA